MMITDQEALSVDDALIDRLVDGELGEADRRAVLRALDGAPGGWKRCALAFVEAQAWREAFAGEGVVGPPLASGSFRQWRPWPHRFGAVAAAVLVAFFTGFATRGTGTPSDNHTGDRRLAQHARDPVTPRVNMSASASPADFASSAVPDYLRRQMERQGYLVEGNVKMVPVALDDGRKVALPVETVSLRYVGQRIH